MRSINSFVIIASLFIQLTDSTAVNDSSAAKVRTMNDSAKVVQCKMKLILQHIKTTK